MRMTFQIQWLTTSNARIQLRREIHDSLLLHPKPLKKEFRVPAEDFFYFKNYIL